MLKVAAVVLGILLAISSVGSVAARTECQSWSIGALVRMADLVEGDNADEVTAKVLAEKRECVDTLYEFLAWTDKAAEATPPFSVTTAELSRLADAGLIAALERPTPRSKSWLERQLHDITHPWDAVFSEQKNYFTALPWLLVVALVWSGASWLNERFQGWRKRRSPEA